MMGKFGRITVSALALMVSFGALDAVSVNSGAARAQSLTQAQLANPPTNPNQALVLLVGLINQVTSNGTLTTNGAGVTDAVIYLMTAFQGDPAAIGFITNALVQAASDVVPALSGPAFANLKEPILGGVKAVVDGWTENGGAGFNLAAFEAFRDEVDTMGGDFSALDDFKTVASNAATRVPTISKNQGDGGSEGNPPVTVTVPQSNPLAGTGNPSPSIPPGGTIAPGGTITFGGFDPGAPVTFTITGVDLGPGSLQ